MIPQEGSDPPILIANPTYDHWIRQDQLLLHGIIFSATENVVPFFAFAESSFDAWTKINKLYANKSRSRMMTLREKLTKPKGSKKVSEYFQNLRSVADELELVNSPVSEDDLVIHVLNGIGSDFKEIAVGVRAQDSSITFEELLDKFTDYEEVIKKQESSTDIIIPFANLATKAISSHSDLLKHSRPSHNTKFTSPSTSSKHSSSTNFKVVCQFCDKPGHSAKHCFKI
ncbi:PREDICTED: uncharacterized protein LOC18592568 [Theobroma cacao]|uniref:Uncharacterized protein LOC18592568 n=1 Tax=Theobroma cacao TaxID=3641 RepID=A0AB32WTT1_THECC|nr:PREDICTED: uncharacterized protein LOC18592568 [Theobroma cacao]